VRGRAPAAEPGAAVVDAVRSITAGVLGLCAVGAFGSQPASTESDDGGVPAVEAYLERFGLDRVLAGHLRQRLDGAIGDERLELAERLGGLYAQLLASAADDATRRELEARSVALLRSVEGVDAFDLRINLALARYLPAERTAERHRFRLVDDEELATARAVLDAVARELETLASKVAVDIRRLENREDRGSDRIDEIRTELAEKRRLRSLASYYSGWAWTHLAELSGRKDAAREGLEAFVLLLGGVDEREPDMQRLPGGQLRLEPVARAALGTAICLAVLDRERDGDAWLDLLDETPETPESVRDRVFGRRVANLAAVGRWSELDVLVNARRNGGRPGRIVGEAPTPLDVKEARLVAVAVMEQVAGIPEDNARRRAAEGVVAQALTDLVSAGEVRQVLDLIQRYGSIPLGGDGFIVRYVRGREAFDRAREAHAAEGGDPDQPTESDRVRAEYIDAASLLRQAYDAPDATRFAVERGKCGLLLGFSLYFRGAFEQAADRLADVAAIAADTEREEAIWFAVVALDGALDGIDFEADSPRFEALQRKRDRLVVQYVSEFPDSSRSALLLLRQSGAATLDDAAAADVLLRVPRSSPLFDVARRQAESRLFQAVVDASAEERPALADRYLTLALELLDADRLNALASRADAERIEVFESLTRRALRALKVSLDPSAPDTAASRRILLIVGEVSDRLGLGFDPRLEAKLLYRRLQIAAFDGTPDRVEPLLAELEAIDAVEAERAARFLFNRARAAAAADEDDAAARAELVRRGRAVLDAARAGGVTTPSEADRVRDAVARAAAALWRLEGDAEMRALAIAFDAESMALGRANGDALRRLGRLGEQAGRADLALEAWRTLSAGTAAGTREWYEARYHAIRLAGDSDPRGALAALEQHVALYPGGGPAPWGERFAALAARLRARVDTSERDANGEGGTP